MVVFFIELPRGALWMVLAARRDFTSAGFVTMIPRVPWPICRRARRRAGAISESCVRGFLPRTRAGSMAGPRRVSALIAEDPVLLARGLRRAGVRGHAAASRFGFGERLVLVGFRLLLASGLVRALLVLALFLGHFVVLLGLGLGRLVLRVRRALALGFEVGLGDLLLRLGFLHADVLRVAGLALARGLVLLVRVVDLLLLSAVVRAHRRFGVLDRMRGGAAGRRGAGLRGRKRRRAEQEGPGQGGVKSCHSHVWAPWGLSI